MGAATGAFTCWQMFLVDVQGWRIRAGTGVLRGKGKLHRCKSEDDIGLGRGRYHQPVCHIFAKVCNEQIVLMAGHRRLSWRQSASVRTGMCCGST